MFVYKLAETTKRVQKLATFLKRYGNFKNSILI